MIFHGDTSSFLLVLALGTSFPMIIALFFIRTIPLPTYEAGSRTEYTVVNEAGPIVDIEASTSAMLGHDNDSHTPLLSPTIEDPPPFIRHSEDDSLIRTSVELSPTRSTSPGTRRSRRHAHRPSFGSAAGMLDGSPNISGRRLWISADFWFLFVIMGLCKLIILAYVAF